MNLGIVGYGYVGKALVRFFTTTHTVAVYDKYDLLYASDSAKAAINACDLAFIAVPTPLGADGWTCDSSELEDVFSWLTIPACIKSTVPPGTTDSLARQRSAATGFSPEYIGESIAHEWKEIDACGFVIIGGSDEITALVARAYTETNHALDIRVATPKLAELCKYMENSFLATKVSFVNQFYDIATCLGVDFETLVALWHLDSRIGSSHSVVTPERGFGGKCLPKDLRAIIAAFRGLVSTDLLSAVLAYNDHIRTSARPRNSANARTEIGSD